MAYSCDLSIVSPRLPYERVLERWLMYTGLFDQEVLRAFYKTELVNFDSEANQLCASRMGHDNLKQLLVGRVAGQNKCKNKFVQELQDGVDELIQTNEMAFVKIHQVRLRGRDRASWTREPQRIPLDRLLILQAVVVTAIHMFYRHDVLLFLGPDDSDRDKPCSGSNWALLTAAFLGDTPTIKALMKRSPNADRPEGLLNRALETAAAAGKVDAVATFLEANVDPNKQGFCKGRPGSCRTLGYACLGGHGTIVDLLLQPCHMVEKQGRAYEDAFFKTIRGPGEGDHGRLRILQSLFANGKFTHPRTLRHNILGEACLWGREDVVRMVIRDLPQLPLAWRGWRPLDIASSRGHMNIVQILLAHEAGQKQEKSDAH
jgi:ankyrin repeat protein